MMKPFEPFHPTQSSGSGRGVPAIRVQANGRIVLNAAASRAVPGDRVRLLWDDDLKRIGLMPTTEPEPITFLISRSASQATITSKEFVQKFPIPFDRRLPLVEENGFWVANTIEAD